jgi:RecA/RadA recombinase
MIESNTFTGYLGPDFQKKLLWQVLTHAEFGEKILPNLNIVYFDDPNLKRLFIVICEYFNDNKKIPNLQNQSIYTAIKKYRIPDDKTDELILEGVIEGIKSWNDMVLNKNLEYDGDVIQNEGFLFIKQQEYRKLSEFIDAKIKNGEIKQKTTVQTIEQKIKDIADIGDDNDYGIEVFDNIERALVKEFREPIPTGIKGIDEVMGGGLGRGEMGIVLAGTGVGKSTILTKFANEAVEHGKNVLQIIFEDTEDQIRRKHFCVWSKVPLMDMDDNIEFVTERVREHRKTLTGKLIIKKFSQENTTLPDIRHWIDRYQKKFGITFDMVVLDYLDCVEPHKNSVDMTHAEINVVKAFEAMAGELNIPCWTALQTNRQGLDSEFVYTSQMGGSIKRAQKSHFLMSVGKTPDQKQSGTANIQILKARFAQDGQQFKDCIFNNNTMEIRTTGDGIIKVNQEQYGKKPVDVDKINSAKTNFLKIEEDIHKNDVVPKEEIKLDLDSKEVLKKLLNIDVPKNEEKNDFNEFLGKS